MKETARGTTTPSSIDLPIAQNIIFSNHAGDYKKGIEKRQTGLLQKLHFLRPFLHPDEKILYVTTSCSPMSGFEQLWTGWIIYYLKRSLLVFTNKRIFHIPTTMRFAYRCSIAQIPYGNCESIGISWGALVIKYKNDKTERFNYIPGSDRKKIKTITEKTLQTSQPVSGMGRVHLCPRCTKELTQDKFECPHCHLLFKNKSEALKISIIYPGGGYFYTGHIFLGISDALTESILLVLIVFSLISLIQGDTNATVTLIWLCIILAFEKIITVYHSNHFLTEYIPKDKELRSLIS